MPLVLNFLNSLNRDDEEPLKENTQSIQNKQTGKGLAVFAAGLL